MATKKTSKKTTGKKGASAKAGTRSGAKTSARAEQVILPGVKRLKSVGWMAILESLVIGVLGIVLLWHPEGVLKAIFYVVGIFLIIKGVYKILNYFATHGQYDFYNNDLLYGIIALVFGVIAVVLWEELGGVIGLVVGAWMIYGALVRINTAIKMRTAGIREWFYVLVLALVMLALGIYMIINMGAVLAVVGWVMIAAAVVGILDDLMFIRHLDELTR